MLLVTELHGKEQFNIYSGIFCEIFLSADLYRLCKLHQKYTYLQFSIAALFQIKFNLV
jgi:hypothetical protein